MLAGLGGPQALLNCVLGRVHFARHGKGVAEVVRCRGGLPSVVDVVGDLDAPSQRVDGVVSSALGGVHLAQLPECIRQPQPVVEFAAE